MLAVGGNAAARAKVEGAAALADARAFRAANPALAGDSAGLTAFRRWRVWAGRGGGPSEAAAEEVLTHLTVSLAPVLSAPLVTQWQCQQRCCCRWPGW